MSHGPRFNLRHERNEKAETTMQNLNETIDTSDKNLILVDIDDLRAAFGGEAASGDAGELAAVPTTIMCPQW